jgi:release factor glutamine methyltransferase
MAPPTVLTVKDALARSAAWLAEKGIESARLDAGLLLGHVLAMGRLDLYLAWDRPLTQKEKDDYRALLKRRADHEPVAYIVGAREFFGLRLRVTPDVLIPRPETEILIERAIELVRLDAAARVSAASPGQGEKSNDAARSVRIADVGTGSGAIAIALAHEIPEACLVATDVSPAALDVARENARTHGVAERIDFRRAALLEGVDGDLDMVVSNPPYVAERDRGSLPPDVVCFEPHGALFAGEDGLSVIADLIPQAAEKLRAGGSLALEIGEGQAAAVAELLAATRQFEAPEIRRDYQGIERVVVARRANAARRSDAG